jgi:hypothetical protein
MRIARARLSRSAPGVPLPTPQPRSIAFHTWGKKVAPPTRRRFGRVEGAVTVEGSDGDIGILSGVATVGIYAVVWGVMGRLF